MKLRYALLALATFCAAPVAAQTYTSSTPLQDRDGDGYITFSVTRGSVPKGSTVQLCPGTTYTYATAPNLCPGAPVAPVAATEPVPAPPPVPLWGASLAGAEASSGDSVRPSLQDWTNYIDRYQFNVIRYPFKMSRMTEARWSELRTNVNYALSKGVKVILDNHNFAWPDVQVQIDTWTAIAPMFPTDGSVIFELNNEPSVSYERFGVEAKQVVNGLRANGVLQPLLLGGPQWSATFRFDKGEAATKACESAGCALDRAPGVLDPLNLTYIAGHRYWDSDSSGTSNTCNTSSSGLDNFAAALRKRGLKGYVTEAAFGNYYAVPATCENVGTDAIVDMKANADVLLGITWWGGGRIWPESYLFKIDCPKADRFTCPNPFVTRLRGQ